MEIFRRKIKVFWVEHGDPIKFYGIIIIAIILIVQGLNAIAVKQNELIEKERREEIEKNTVSVKIQENKNYTEIVESFIDYCKKGQIEKAYELISEDCKKNMYPTINDFRIKYINEMFIKNYDISVEYTDNNIYKIIFKQDILEAGSEKNRKAIEQYYKIETEELKSKIYINYKNN